eukprot:6777797-Prorocentrum_lima.AAC.1
MTSSLVGSEMCIRDRNCVMVTWCITAPSEHRLAGEQLPASLHQRLSGDCLLYTSDAADDM